MKRKISLFVAAVFMAVQMLSFQHMAAHGFSEHEHNGKPCEISAYFHQSESFDSAANAPVISHDIIFTSAAHDAAADEISVPVFAYTQNPRAPPANLPA